MTTARVLIVVDESHASQRAVAYVGRIIGRRRGSRLCLAHVLPRLSPRLHDFRSTENPSEEKRLKARRQRWLAAAKKTAERTLTAARATLRRAGVPERALGIRLSEAVDHTRVGERILELAHARKCDTVVVGRESVSWYRALLGGDLSEELVRRGQGFTIWIVE